MIDQLCEKVINLECDTMDIRSTVDTQLDYVGNRLANCQSLAESAYERANAGFTYEPDINRIADVVADLVAERVMDRVWAMIDDAKNVPSEKEFLTGIERLLLE